MTDEPGPSIDDLVERAATRAFDASIIEGLEEPPHLRGLSFAELVELARVRADAATPDNPLRRRAVSRATRVLGPGASNEQVDDLARRTHAAMFLSEALAYRPEELSHAPLEGEGVELLRDRSRGTLLAFAHTTTSPIGFYALPRGLDRLIFVPNERVPAQAAPLRIRQFWCEEYGIRYVPGDKVCIEVLEVLLGRGEVCALAVDQPGDTEATFFGARVKTKAGAAVLARRTGVPVVVVTSWNDDERFGVTVSRPFQAADFESVTAMHQALLTQVETQLGDIVRFVGELQMTRVPEAEPALDA
jgi:lauroyl/myristoyl acyltransferase